MAKVRVYELAKELGVESKTVLSMLKDMGEFVRSASSTVEAPVERRLKEKLASEPPPAKKTAKKAPAAKTAEAPVVEAAAPKAVTAPAEPAQQAPVTVEAPPRRRGRCCTARTGCTHSPIWAASCSGGAQPRRTGCRHPVPGPAYPGRPVSCHPRRGPVRPPATGRLSLALAHDLARPADCLVARPDPGAREPRARATTRSPRPRAWASGVRRGRRPTPSGRAEPSLRPAARRQPVADGPACRGCRDRTRR